jgi:hypothetical protein
MRPTGRVPLLHGGIGRGLVDKHQSGRVKHALFPMNGTLCIIRPLMK